MIKAKQSNFRFLKRKDLSLYAILIISIIGLLGWFIGKESLASFSLSFVPMAPATAILFFTLSIAMLVSIKRDKAVFENLFVTSLVFLATLFCGFIFLDFVFYFNFDIENAFIKNPEFVGGIQKGRMSPITSLLFIFICLGIIAIWQNNSKIVKYIGGSFSLFVCIASSVLCIGYLYKAPLLYGSSIISVALPTAICFLLFSITLLRVCEFQFWSFNLIKYNTVKRLLFKSFLPIVVIIIILQGFLITNFSFNHNNPTLSASFILLAFIAITITIVYKVADIIEFKLRSTEEKVRDTQILLQSSIVSPKGMIILSIDKHYQYLYFNAFHKESMIYAYGKEVQIGMNLLDCITDEGDRIKAKENYDRALAGESHITIQEFGDIERYYYETRYSPILNDNNEIIGATAFSANITDRKRAEIALQQSEEKFSVMFQKAPFAAALSGISDFKFVEVNEQFEKLWRYSSAEVIGKTSQELELYPDINERARMSAIFLEKGFIHEVETKMITKTGELKDVLVNSDIVKIGNEQFVLSTVQNITEPKQLEFERQKFVMLANSSSEFIGMCDLNLQPIFVNPSGIRMVGLPDLAEACRVKVQDYFFPEDQRFIEEEFFPRVMNEGEGDIEIRLRHFQTGAPIWMLYYLFRVSDSSGKPVGWATVSRDITERKQAEEILRKSEAIKNTMVSNIGDVIVIIDQNGINQYKSPNVTKLFGWKPEELIGKSTWDNVHPDDTEAAQKFMGTIATEPNAVGTTEVRYKRKDGEYVWIVISVINLLHDKDIQGILGNYHDNTKRKLAEEKIREKDIQFRKLSANVPDLLFQFTRRVDGTYYVPIASEGIKNIFGCAPEDVLDDFTPIGSVIFPDDAARVITDIEYSAEHLTYFTCEFRVQIPGKPIQWIFSRSMPEKLADGSVTWYGFNANITERKQTEFMLQEKNIEIEAQNEEYKQINEELYIAKEHAEESDRLKTVFLQNMSHEIRTPMNAIMGFSELLVNQYNNKPKLEKFSAIIRQRCNDLLDIINDLLDISKIESGQLPIQIEECNLNALFSELKLFYTQQQIRLCKEHIEFNLQALSGSSEIIILTDKVKLKNIFINLISNAFKFTDMGSIEGGCKLDENGNLMFYVTDTGIGIPPDKQQLIFERFKQLEQGENRLYGGTGLGLSIVRGLVGLLGGEIFVKSEPGKGSTFSFTMPYNIVQAKQKEPKNIEVYEKYSFFNKTILIVEDDLPNAEYLKEILTDTGINILHAEYGNKAVEIALGQHVDLILMDIRLPDMNGYEATRQIRQHKPDLIIIAQTAYASNDDKQLALEEGCNDYISKPINQITLLSLINKHLEA